MSSKSGKQPSALYVFVVISLAAFLTLFTLWRRPRTQYVASVTAPLVSTFGGEGNEQSELLGEIRNTLIAPESVLQSLKNADMIKGQATPDMRRIADEIASKLRLIQVEIQGKSSLKLALATEHPQVGIRLLEQMAKDFQTNDAVSSKMMAPGSAIASRVRGTSIRASSLVLLVLCSALVGVGGLMLLEQSKQTSVLLNEEDVIETTRLAVIADFSRHVELPARTRKTAWRRRFGAAVRVAELAIAAAILVIIYNVATQHAFSDLLVSDPLSAYSEAVGRILG